MPRTAPCCGEPDGDQCDWLAQDLLVHEVVTNTARRFPTATAVEVVTDGVLRTPAGVTPDRYTYAEIKDMAFALADRLRKCIDSALHHEPKVVVLVEEGVGLVVCELGVLKSGGAFVPVDPTWPRDRQVFIIRDCGARVVLLPRVDALAQRTRLAGKDLVVCEGEAYFSACSPEQVLTLVWEDVVERSVCASNASRSLSVSPPDPLPALHGATKRSLRCSHVIYTSVSALLSRAPPFRSVVLGPAIAHAQIVTAV